MRWPGRKNGTCRPGPDVLVRDGGPGVGLSGHLLLTHEPTHIFNLPDLLFYILNTFMFQKFAYWPVHHKSLPKERNYFCVLAQKIQGNNFHCSTVHTAPLQHGAESTRAFGLLFSRAETTIGHQCWPGCLWYRSVSYTSTGRWPLATYDTNSHRCW